MAWRPDYITSTELKNYVRIGDDQDDVEVGLAITAASRAIDRACGRQFGKVDSAVVRYYTAYTHPVLLRNVVDIDDLYSVTGLEVDVDSDGDETYATALDIFTVQPLNAAADGKPWSRIAVGPSATVSMPTTADAVRVSGLFGWSAVPGPIKQATLLQASRFLSRRNSPYGVAGSPENGSELRLLAKVDPDVEVALADFKRSDGPKDWFA